MKSYIITAGSGKVAMPEPELEGGMFSLGQLQAAVGGGYIERVYPHPLADFPATLTALADEEGILKGLPHNEVASLLLGVPLSGDIAIIQNTEWQ